MNHPLPPPSTPPSLAVAAKGWPKLMKIFSVVVVEGRRMRERGCQTGEWGVVQRENHLIFNYADFSPVLSVIFFCWVLEAKQLGIANTLEINTRATPIGPISAPLFAIARSCRRDAKMQRLWWHGQGDGGGGRVRPKWLAVGSCSATWATWGTCHG